MSRGARKNAKRARKMRGLAACAPLAAAFARYESRRGWDGRLASYPRPAEAWVRAASAVLAWLLT